MQNHLKAVLKSEVMDQFDDKEEAPSVVSVYSSNSSNDDDFETESSSKIFFLKIVQRIIKKEFMFSTFY